MFLNLTLASGHTSPIIASGILNPALAYLPCSRALHVKCRLLPEDLITSPNIGAWHDWQKSNSYEPSAASGEPTGVALFGIKRFSLIDYFSRSRGYRGLLSSICYDYNYHSNDGLQLRSILPYHDITYLCLSWASITYTYDDMYTQVGRHHEGG